MTDRAGSELLDLLRARQAEETTKKTDWDAVRDEWIAVVDAFLRQVEEWLKPAVDQGLATVRREQLQVVEEALGPYTTGQLRVGFPGRQVLVVRPIGRVVVGGKGRIDFVVGPRNAMIVRGTDDTWSLARRAPRLEMVPLTPILFESVVADLLSGE